MPFLSALKDKGVLITTPSGAYALPDKGENKKLGHR